MVSLGRIFIRRAAKGASILLLCVGATATWAASFDCTKARTATETAICFDAETSALDEKMVSAYKNRLQTGADAKVVRQSQRDWLKFVRNACTSLECLRSAYIARIEDLSEGQADKLNLSPSIARALSSVENSPEGVSYGSTSGEYVAIREWMIKSKVLEESVARAGNVRLPKGLRVSAQDCGEINAYYVASKRAVVICYELVDVLWRSTLSRPRPSKEDVVSGYQLSYGIQYVVLHEIGHAAFSVQEGGYFGSEETAADYFANYSLLNGMSLNESINSTWGVWTVFNVLKSEGNLDSGHDYSSQRLNGFFCMASATSRALGDAILEKKLISKKRFPLCVRSWELAKRAMDKWSVEN
ncbi:DUF4344 domain-containing metallopeptidase [Delftia lacustris]|uniref:DUF4344 domain-containing metallopeptidase n=1 Tax=Delftia lacustris TaxID=558537 RepID=UPI002860D7BC|nr:DUF4344 domain-containing metallopeptidase [Delftia lacustris]MDR6728070.1 uncharacterized protein [Delftia lacustris]